MTKLSKFKLLPYFLFLGILFLGLGISAVYLNQGPDPYSGLMLSVGLIFLIYTLFKMIIFSKGISFQHQLKSNLWKLTLVILLSGLLVYSNKIAKQYDIRVDLTKTKQHTLSDQTISLLNDVKRDIRVTALMVGIPPKYLEDLLQQYQELTNGRIKTEIIDPIEQIGYASQFGNIINGKESKVILQSGQERQEIDFSKEPLTEELLNNSILRLSRKSREACFLTGHHEYELFNEDETGLNILAQLLLGNNILPKEIFLGVLQQVPDSCDILVIAGPKDLLSRGEIDMIDGYMKTGGDVFFMTENTLVTTEDRPLTDDEKKLNPSLNEILSRWGLRVASDIVVDLSNHASGDVGSPATKNYLTHRAIVGDLDYTFFVRPRSISMMSGRSKSIKLAPLILTMPGENSWGESDRMLKVQFDDLLDRPGPVPFAYVGWEKKEAAARSDTRFIVITDADFLTNAYISSYSNAKLALNVINWLSEMDYQVLVNNKEIKVEQLMLSSYQRRVVACILFMMPLMIAAAGLVVWVNNKN